jgi:hypothetical protein
MVTSLSAKSFGVMGVCHIDVFKRMLNRHMASIRRLKKGARILEASEGGAL